MAITLDPHQVAGVEYALAHHYSINADEMGLGKTFQALTVSLKTKLPTLIICPAYLRENWQSEIKTIAPEKGVTVFRKISEIYPPFDTDFVIISYSQIEQAKDCFRWAEMLIADEVHMVKNMECKRGMLFHIRVYESQAKRAVYLTGTPIKNHVSDFYSLLGLTAYNLKNTSGKDIFLEFPTPVDYNEEFCLSRVVRTPNGYTKKYFGLKNKVKLKTYLKDCFISRKAKDVLNLKELRFKHVIVDYDLKEEKELWDDFQQNKATNSKSKNKNAMIKAKFTVKYVKGLISENPEKYYLVYTDHIESAKAMAQGLNCACITGLTPSSKRGYMALEYKKGKYRTLVATIGSFSTGVNLTLSHNLIVNDLSWTPGDLAQTFKRIHRRGQKEPCTIHLVEGSNQDKYISNLLLEKTKNIKELLE